MKHGVYTGSSLQIGDPSYRSFFVGKKCSRTEIYRQSCDVYGPNKISRQGTGKRCISFGNGHKDTEDDHRGGGPSTVTTNVNVERVKQLIDANRRVSADSLKRLRERSKIGGQESRRKTLSSSATMPRHTRHDPQRTSCKNLSGKCGNTLRDSLKPVSPRDFRRF